MKVSTLIIVILHISVIYVVCVHSVMEKIHQGINEKIVKNPFRHSE